MTAPPASQRHRQVRVLLGGRGRGHQCTLANISTDKDTNIKFFCHQLFFGISCNQADRINFHVCYAVVASGPVEYQMTLSCYITVYFTAHHINRIISERDLSLLLLRHFQSHLQPVLTCTLRAASRNSVSVVVGWPCTWL